MTRTLSTRYVQLAVTTAAARTSSNPLVTAVDLGNVILDEVEVSLPGGSVGLVGFNIALAQQVILPYGGNAGFIIRESSDRIYLLDIEVDRGLAVRTYNTDKHAHVVYFTFRVHDIGADETAPSLITPLAL